MHPKLAVRMHGSSTGIIGLGPALPPPPPPQPDNAPVQAIMKQKKSLFVFIDFSMTER